MSAIGEVVFGRKNKLYYPGETVSGVVKVQCDCDYACNYITLHVEGKVVVDFSHLAPGNDYDEDRYKNRQYLLEMQIRLWGDGGYTKLHYGSHNFKFGFMLPANIPPSFITYYGYVAFSARATLELSMEEDVSFFNRFHVGHVADLNVLSGVKDPVKWQKSGTASCLCCWKRGPVSFSIGIPKKGFVCGEAITFKGTCENESGSHIHSSKAELCQKVTYYSRSGRTYVHDDVIKSVKHGEIQPGASFEWNDSLSIPSLVAQQFECGPIKLEYFVKFVMSAGCTTLKVKESINIGNVPLKKDFPIFAEAPRGDCNGPCNKEAIFPGCRRYPDLPLPDFVRGFYDNVFDPEHRGRHQPVFPVYCLRDSVLKGGTLMLIVENLVPPENSSHPSAPAEE